MKKILCPTDFSDTAYNAIAYAAKLAQVIGGELILLNVQSIFDLTPAEIVRGKEMSIAAVRAQLEEQSLEVSRVFKISCYAEVEPTFRELSTVIHDNAKNYDLIVMGSNGADDLYEFFFGSNTYNAIKKSEIPVLIVPEDYTYSEIKNVVFAFDYLHERTLPLPRIAPLLKALNCKLTILQVVKEAYSKAAGTDLRELQVLIKKFYGNDIAFGYDTIHSTEVGQSINSYVLRNESDVLVLCSVHRDLIQTLFHKSVIKHISAICNYPVIVFHQ